jgi:thymidine phosphorylase
MDAELIGRASVLLGAGRQKAGDAIDFAVGISGIKKIGQHVDLEEPLLFIHAHNDQTLGSELPRLERAIELA